jgi:hypothetical protein
LGSWPSASRRATAAWSPRYTASDSDSVLRGHSGCLPAAAARRRRPPSCACRSGRRAADRPHRSWRSGAPSSASSACGTVLTLLSSRTLAAHADPGRGSRIRRRTAFCAVQGRGCGRSSGPATPDGIPDQVSGGVQEHFGIGPLAAALAPAGIIGGLAFLGPQFGRGEGSAATLTLSGLSAAALIVTRVARMGPIPSTTLTDSLSGSATMRRPRISTFNPDTRGKSGSLASRRRRKPFGRPRKGPPCDSVAPTTIRTGRITAQSARRTSGTSASLERTFHR